MSLLPLPTRLPARKHLLAGLFAVVGLGFMLLAVLTASGLSLPFTSHGSSSVRSDAVLVNTPETTTTTTPAGGQPVIAVSRALAPAAVPGPTAGPSTPATTAPPRGGTTPPESSTTLPTVPTAPTLVPPLGGLGQAFNRP
jgi:hypothetical protein